MQLDAADDISRTMDPSLVARGVRSRFAGAAVVVRLISSMRGCGRAVLLVGVVGVGGEATCRRKTPHAPRGIDEGRVPDDCAWFAERGEAHLILPREGIAITKEKTMEATVLFPGNYCLPEAPADNFRAEFEDGTGLS